MDKVIGSGLWSRISGKIFVLFQNLHSHTITRSCTKTHNQSHTFEGSTESFNTSYRRQHEAKDIDLKEMSLIDIQSKDEMGEIESLTKSLEKNLSISGKGEDFLPWNQRVFFRRLLDENRFVKFWRWVQCRSLSSDVLSTRSDIHVTSHSIWVNTKCIKIAKKYVDGYVRDGIELLWVIQNVENVGE